MTTREPAATATGASTFLRLAAFAAFAFLLAPPAEGFASPGTGTFASVSHARVAADAPQLAKNFKASSHAPARGSSADLYGGSSADRYGGSSADERGVAGKHDPRNKGVRQFTVQNQKRKKAEAQRVETKHKDEEMEDQDANPPKEMFQFGIPDPSQSRDRGGKD